NKACENTQTRQVCCDVAGSTCGLPLALYFNQRNRSFVGNAKRTTLEIAIQDEIADDKQFNARECANDLGEPFFADFQFNLLGIGRIERAGRTVTLAQVPSPTTHK